MEKKVILETRAIGGIKGVFLIPSYQRGYRWSEVDVKTLLNDIAENITRGENKKNYYLQPIVVKEENGKHKLIDGQQRLSTIYILLKYMCEKKVIESIEYSIEYDNSPGSKEFLEKIESAKNKVSDNINFYYMREAYQTIEQWFKTGQGKDIGVEKFYEYLIKKVQVIWYEVDPSEDEISLFTRLNIGKIPLTVAELVKALFLCNNKSNRVKEIALQWDYMERELQDNDFWAFLTNDIDTYETRIDLVLDLVAEKKSESNPDKYFTFFKFDEDWKNSSPKESDDLLDNEVWGKIYKAFLTLKDWYEDYDLYHIIGYLITSGSKDLADIYESLFKKGQDDKKEEIEKESFKKRLVGKVTESIKLDKKNYADLSYNDATDAKKIRMLLTLFNIEYVRQKGVDRFPFQKFKNMQYSLEHIHAQNSEGLSKREDWRSWLKLHLEFLKGVDIESEDGIDNSEKKKEKEELIKEMERAAEDFKHKKGSLGEEDFKGLRERAVAFLSDKDASDYVHSIANLALLDKDMNAVFNNSTFAVKRREMIKMDMAGKYIPVCTRNVFLKYYTSDPKHTQLYLWSQADREGYVKAINDTLKGYKCDFLYRLGGE